jgi:hypothetical protein
MLTDEQIRTAFHDRAGTSLDGVTPYPDLLGDLRRRHRQRARLAAIGAPLGVVLLAAVAVVGVHLASGSSAGGHQGQPATAASPSASTQPPPPDLTAPGPEVRLFDHTFTMPPDWHVTSVRHRGRNGLLDTRTDSATAVGSGDFVTVMEFRGALARARYRATHPTLGKLVPTKIAGDPAVATLHIGPRNISTLRVLVTSRDSLLITAHGLPLAELEDIARAALHSSP